SAVPESSDPGVMEARENLALEKEPPPDDVALQATFHEFDRDALLELAVRAFRKVYGTHAATSQLVDDAVRPDARALEHLIGHEGTAVRLPGLRVEERGDIRRHVALEEGHLVGIGEHRFDSRAERRVVRARAIEIRCTLGRREGERAVENSVDVVG